MRRHRLTARGIPFLTLLCLAFAPGASAAPDATDGTKVPRLIFPILGEAAFGDDFGDPRGQGGHEGTDIMAPRKAIVVAAEAGTVKFWTTSARAGCMLYLYGASGTTYLYVHLNNDLTDRNDNRGSCVGGVAYAPGLKNGARVAAGQPIAFNGDSGDANGISPHVHFEVHPGDGAATNPFKHLRSAQRLLFSAKPGTTFSLALTGKLVQTEAEGLQLEVEQVRSWPGGRRIPQAGQKVAVTVPPDASIEGVAGPSALAAVSLELLEPGSSVTVFTMPAKTTLAAQTGARGALAAKRVVLKK